MAVRELLDGFTGGVALGGRWISNLQYVDDIILIAGTKRTNDWVLEKARVRQEFLPEIRRRKLSFFGHVVRKPQLCLEKDIIQGTIPGQRKKGRPRTSWTDDIKAWTGMTPEQALRAANEQQRWRRLVHDATNPRIEDG
ncbi:uncharacterized protein LOC143223894 [Tachypleus tridentatus]|uniref:uncharacterized protein LOC143223894 n=1 Tax=Tachypleus tridentatus TaxID=6853 RepID=UPI003FD63496